MRGDMWTCSQVDERDREDDRDTRGLVRGYVLFGSFVIVGLVSILAAVVGTACVSWCLSCGSRRQPTGFAPQR